MNVRRSSGSQEKKKEEEMRRRRAIDKYFLVLDGRSLEPFQRSTAP